MVKFLREYWLWIVAPFVLAIGGLATLLILAGGDTASPFIYNVF